jgi:hypothetical protein
VLPSTVPAAQAGDLAPGDLQRNRRAAVKRQPPLCAAFGPGRIRSGGIGLVALLLAACSSSKPPPAPVAVACPAALILDGAERTTSYRGSERSPDALQYLAVLTHLQSACSYNDKGVDVDLALDLIAQRGPAAQDEKASLTYFVATIGPNRQVLSKRLLPSTIEFTKGEELAGVNEQLTLRLPSVTPEQAPGYSLYLGFQLDEADLQRRLQPLLR